MKKISRVNHKEVILRTIGLAGLLAVSAVAPGVLVLYKKHKKIQYEKQSRNYINRVTQNLIKNGFIEIKANEKGIKCLRLTNRGQETLKEYALVGLEIKKPWRWDHKYRVIIFDIKEFKRATRDKLRRWLEHLGFVRLQNSVWVYPYDCREVVVLLKANFKIGKEVLYMTVDSIENDKWLKKEFGLVG